MFHTIADIQTKPFIKVILIRAIVKYPTKCLRKV